MEDEPIEMEFELPEHLYFGTERRKSGRDIHRGGQLWIWIDAVPQTESHPEQELPHAILKKLRPYLERHALSFDAPLHHGLALVIFWKDSEIEGRLRTDSLTREHIAMLAEQLQSIPSVSVKRIREFRTLGTWGRNILEAEWHAVDGKLVRSPSPHPRYGGRLNEIALVPLVCDGATVYALVGKEELLKDPVHPKAFWNGPTAAAACEELKSLKMHGVSLIISSHPLYKEGDWPDHLTVFRELRSHHLNPNVVYFENTEPASYMLRALHPFLQ